MIEALNQEQKLTAKLLKKKNVPKGEVGSLSGRLENLKELVAGLREEIAGKNKLIEELENELCEKENKTASATTEA